MKRFPHISEKPPLKIFHPFTDPILLAFLWNSNGCRCKFRKICMICAKLMLYLLFVQLCLRFKIMLRFTEFNNKNTSVESAQTDKATIIGKIRIMVNKNLVKIYKLYEYIVINEQLFPFRGHINFIWCTPCKSVVGKLRPAMTFCAARKKLEQITLLSLHF